MRLTPAHISPFAGTRQSKPTPSGVALWNVASSAPPWRGLPGPSMVGRQTTPHDALLPHRRLVRDAAGPPSGPGPGRGPRQRPQRRAGHRLRDVGLSVSLLPRVRARHAAAAGAGVCPDGQGPFRLHQPAPPGRAQKCHRGGGSRPVRRAPAAVLAHARLAVRSSGRMGPTRVPAVVFSRTERFAGTGAGRVRPLCDVRCDRRFRPRRRRTSAPRRRHGHAQLLYRRSAARRGGAGRGVPSGAGLDLPEQDGALMRGARPSFIYRLSIRLAQQALPLAARFDKKVARGLEARRGVTARLAAWARAHREPSRPLLWVHASSVGEGLQAKPVLEAVRAEVPQWQLAYTFFSPSAERLARTLPVDIADYLPLDRPAEVSAALDALKPAALVFSKLDVWPELTLAAAQRGVRLGLISATVAPHSSRLRWPARGWAEPAYRALERIGTISEEDGERLELLGARPETIAVTGDTRYDSVAERAARLDRTREPLARLATTAPDTFTIVTGSTWPSDEAVLLPAFADLLHQLPTARLLLAPHEPNPDHLAGISERLRHLKLPRPVRLSQLEHAKPGPVIVVDRVGILADLYALADVAFVGGGFHRAGLHSVLEPAVFGVPIIFGPHWRMSRDAALLLEKGGAVALPADARHPLHSQWLVWHHDPAARVTAGLAAKLMVAAGRGASERTTALVRGLVQS